MIAHIFGEVAEKGLSSVIVDVGGIGYDIQLPLSDYEKAEVGAKIKFYTYHHIREQAQELYGFSTLTAKKIFELLITVQGVGPKAALSIMSLGDTEIIRNAIANSDAIFIAKASGVGKKTAERVVVDLSDKVGYATKYDFSRSVISNKDEAMEALMSLGFNLNDAARALEGVPVDLPTAERVTMALRNK